VTVLLPKGYDEGTSFPVLYALSGAADNNDRLWAKTTDIKSFAGQHGAVSVLLPTERGGFYSNWIDGSRKWETFHTREMPALIKKAVKVSDRQALMGISLGGFAAMKYAAHNPGRYVAAASMSGVLVSSAPGTTALYQTGMKLNGQNFRDIWGDPIRDSDKWAYEDPSRHIDELRGTNLFVSSATGLPTFNNSQGDAGPLQRVGSVLKDPTDVKSQVLGVALEQSSYETSVLFAKKAKSAGLNVTTSYSLRGQHDWGMWKDEYKVAWSEVIAPSLGLPY
jgi:S-formylglutathione hydrolase FrmB